MSTLFSPFSIGQIALSNRIAIAPMCQYSAVDGSATDWHMMHLGSLALSGAGVLFTEATAVNPVGRISPTDLGLYSDENEAALRRVVEAIRSHSSIPLAIQLGHAGRKGSSQAPWDGGQSIAEQDGGWQTVAPSAVAHADGEPLPLELDVRGLENIKQDFVAAAMRAHRTGFDIIELHAAHGYLLHEFLSPLSNLRGDAYGGSLANRMRFPLEIFDALRAALPSAFPIGVRISATDWVEGGWDLEQSIVFAHELKQRGCAFIDVSSGGISPFQKIPVGPGYQVHFAARIKNDTALPTIAVGMITDPDHAEQIVAGGDADMVALARGILYNPHWPWHAAAKLGAQVKAPRQYWRSQPREYKNLFGDTTLGQR